MKYYPVLIDLKDKECLVVGAGNVGIRKIKLLLKFSPKKVIVVDPSLSQELKTELKKYANIEIKEREFKEEDLNEKWLVIASTNDKALNSKISLLCKNKKILCNIVDQPELSSFIVPATVVKDDFVVAVSTSGSSPAFAKKIKEKIADLLTEEYVICLRLLKLLRPYILSLNLTSQQKKDIFYSITEEHILEGIRRKDKSFVIEELKKILPEELKKVVSEIVNECIA